MWKLRRLQCILKWLTGGSRQQTIVKRLAQLSIEELQPRIAPAWIGLGPSPQETGQAPNDVKYSGRDSAIVIGQLSAGRPAMFVGAASGGVWRTVNLAPGSMSEFSDTPAWTQVSYKVTLANGNAVPIGQLAGINNIGSLAVDPNNQSIIYAGTGEANYSKDSSAGAGILKSTNGGDSWILVAQGTAAGTTEFIGQSISKIIVAPRANTNGGNNPSGTLGSECTHRSRRNLQEHNRWPNLDQAQCDERKW